MPTIVERNGQFMARVRQQGFAPVSRTFRRKSDALAWARRTEVDMQAGRWVDKAAAVPTLREAIKTYRAQVADKMKGGEFYAYTFDQLSQEGFASKRLDAVTAADVAGWRDSMAARGLAAGTVVRRLGLLGGLLTWAHQERGWVAGNVVKGVRRPRVNDARERVLTDEERRCLLAGADSGRVAWLGDALRVLLHSAMRRGELWGLKASDVDLSQGVARLADTKNGSARDVPLCPDAQAALARLVVGAQDRAARARRAGRTAPAQGEEPLIPVDDAHAVTQAFKRALARGVALHVKDCAARGADADPAFLAGVRLHDLRHCAVTAWARTGALSLPELAAISGHKTPRMLMRYVNLSASGLARKLATLTAPAAAPEGATA